MGKNKNISDELLAAYLEGNVTKEEMAQVLEAIGTDAEIQEILDIALRLEEEEEEQDPVLRVAAEGGRNLCDIQCEAFVLRRRGIDTNEEELFGVAKENHWIRRVGEPLRDGGR